MKKIKGILLLCCILLMTGCIKNTFENENNIDMNEVKQSVNEYYHEFFSKYLQGKITVKESELEDKWGTIWQFMDEEGNAIRYAFRLYWEEGEARCEYYFINDYIYVSVLREYYTNSIYDNENIPYILYRTLNEGVIYKDTVYKFENGKVMKSNLEDMGLPYMTKEELSDLIKY